MPRSDGERLATVEAELRALGADVEANTAELGRARTRLHELEGTVQGMVTLERESRRVTVERQRRFELRLELLTVVVGVAGVVLPIVLAIVLTH